MQKYTNKRNKLESMKSKKHFKKRKTGEEVKNQLEPINQNAIDESCLTAKFLLHRAFHT